MPDPARSSSFAVRLCWVQGLYFLLTGMWPLVSVKTFQDVTGPKSDHLIAKQPSEADHWMLYTISGLIVAVAVVLLAAAWRRRPSLEVLLLGVLSAAVLTTVDLVYVARATIRPIYLVDAAAEIAIIGAWLWLAVRKATFGNTTGAAPPQR